MITAAMKSLLNAIGSKEAQDTDSKLARSMLDFSGLTGVCTAAPDLTIANLLWRPTMADLTQARLREVLNYDPETGVFTWKISKSGGHIKSGRLAGSANSKGYIQIKFEGVSYKAHRLAWLYMTGRWPAEEIDHEDLDKGNNRWSNLREATQSQQVANRPVLKSSRSGLKGIRLCKHSGKWWARIRVQNKRVSLGCFDTPEAAHAAYCRAAVKHFGEFARAQ